MSYLCNRNKKTKQQLEPAATDKRRKKMRHFVFKIENTSDYQLVFSTSMKQAENDMGSKCVAAFMYKEDAEAFVEEYNNMWK